MAAVKISALPPVSVALLPDFFPVVQAGVTSRETLQQVLTLFNANIQLVSILQVTGVGTPTGTGNIVFSNGPTLNQPNIVGTTTNDNAAAGSVGEFVSSIVLAASSVSVPSTDTNINITSISLTAGDWDVWGNTGITYSNSPVTVFGWISQTSATSPDLALYSTFQAFTSGTASMAVPSQRFSLAATTTIYLSGTVGFVAGTASMCGAIFARRRR